MHNALTKTKYPFFLKHKWRRCIPDIDYDFIASHISRIARRLFTVRTDSYRPPRRAAAPRFIVSVCRDWWLLFVCGKEIKSAGDAIVWRWRVLRDRRGGTSVTSPVAGYRAAPDCRRSWLRLREEDGRGDRDVQLTGEPLHLLCVGESLLRT